MRRDLHLIPAPKVLVRGTGKFVFSAGMYVVLPARPAGVDFFGAERFIIEAERLVGRHFQIAAGEGVDPAAEIRGAIDAGMNTGLPEGVRGQSYRLRVGAGGIRIDAPGAAGIFYGFQTLLQIVRQSAFEKRESEGRKRKGQISDFKSQISDFKSQSSDLKSQSSDFKSQSSDFKSQSSDLKSQSSDFKSQSSDFKSQNSDFSIPCVDISDHPDFARRGVYHDTARGKVPTVDTVLQLIDDLAHLKYNEFQLYIENNFEFRKFPEMYDDTDPFTAEELLLLDGACRARHMDFVPSLTSLGHFEKILSRPKFRHLAEAEPAELKAIGAPVWHEAGPWSLCVTDPGAKRLLADMYAEFAPNFSSGQFNICCDEAYDLGKVRSKKLADKIGTGQMYVDWINYCNELVQKHSPGRAIQMWGDIILNHPELIAQLPGDTTLLEWGYEHDHKFDEHCRIFAERLGEKGKIENRKLKKGEARGASRSFYVAPGTSSWLTLSARTKNACGNIHAAAVAGLKYGARGILVTDWGDHGHQQMLSVSMVPFAYGAAAGWNLAATPNPANIKEKNIKYKMDNLLHAISLHLFGDASGELAGLAYDLGLTYERLGWQRFNASLDHFLFREKWDFANYVNRAPAAALRETIAATDKLLGQFEVARIEHPEGELICAEFVFTCREIIHTCRRTLLRQRWLAADPARRNPEQETLRGLRPKALPNDFRRRMKEMAGGARQLERDFSKLWFARNKRSRRADIAAEFGRLVNEYRKFAR